MSEPSYNLGTSDDSWQADTETVQKYNNDAGLAMTGHHVYNASNSPTLVSSTYSNRNRQSVQNRAIMLSASTGNLPSREYPFPVIAQPAPAQMVNRQSRISTTTSPNSSSTSSTTPKEDGSQIYTLDGLISASMGNADTNTHLRFFNPRQFFAVDKSSVFWPAYCRLAMTDYLNTDLAIGEIVNNSNMPLVSEIKLVFKDENVDNFSEDNILIRTIVSLYQDVINKNIDISKLSDQNTDVILQEKELMAVLLKSEQHETRTGKMAFYFRIYFPYCRVSKHFIETTINAEIRNQFDVIIDRLNGFKPIGQPDTIVYTPLVSGSLPMYYSRASKSQPVLKYHQVYSLIDYDSIEEDEEDEYTIDPEDIFPIKRHSHITGGLISVEEFDMTEDFSYYYPWLLSIYYYTNLSKVAENVIAKSNKLSRIAKEEEDDEDEYEDESEEIDDEYPQYLARQFMPMISTKRYVQENFWVDIGQALYNITDGADEGLNWWIRESMRGQKYNDDDCRQKWYDWMCSTTPLNPSAKTLAYYARQDSKSKYNSWHNDWCKPVLSKAATEFNHYNVANAMYRLYWLDYCNAGVNKNSWYKFNGHHWAPMPSGSELRLKINRQVVRHYEKMRTEASFKQQKLGNNSTATTMKANLEALIEKITKLIKSLGSTSNSNNIMTECQNIFFDHRFNELRDQKFSLLGVSNGVIETTDTNAVFRPGKPEDYLTKFTVVGYDKKMNWKSRKVREVMTWVRQTFIDKDLCETFLRLLASRLRSGNPDKIFPVLSGESGDNSKSMWKKLIEQTFGPHYCSTLPDTILTEKERRGSASPEIARSDGSKIAMVMEPDEGQPILNSILKLLTGGDSFFARKLNENGKEILATFVLFMMCNKIPIIPRSEKAVYNRLVVIPFLSTWVDPHLAPRDPEEQYLSRTFPKDPNFDRKIPTMTKAFLWILVQKYQDYLKHGLQVPDVVRKYTCKYWQETDVYELFKKDRIKLAIIPGTQTEINPEGDLDLTQGMAADEIYRMFSSWYRENYPKDTPPQRPNVIRELKRRWGDLVNGQWNGIQAKVNTGYLNI